LDEKRTYEILLAAKKVDLRNNFALRDIANIKRNAGNLVKEPEMVAIKATTEEIVELALKLITTIFNEQTQALAFSKQ